MLTISRFDEVISRFRPVRVAKSRMAPAVDSNEYWRRLALKAIDGGYFRNADEFIRFVDSCKRYLGFEQVGQDRGCAHGIRNLAEAIARQWACGSAPKSAPTADEVAGLLQSEWVASDQFRMLRTTGN